MALNLSTLTNASTSATVLAEAQTTADFLDSVPILKNIARGSNKGGDGKQTTALNQPKALPVVDGKGYLYLSGVAGNYASVSDVTNLVGLGDFVMEAKDVHIPDWTASGSDAFVSIYAAGGYSFLFRRTNTSVQCILLFSGSAPDSQPSFAHGLTGAATASFRILRSGASISMEMDTGAGYITMMTAASTTETLAGTAGTLEIGARDLGVNGPLLGKIGQATIWNNGTQAGDPVLDVDFTATNIRHNDTKFKCATGQTVTINQSGNDPATVIKKSVLRFANLSNDTTSIGLQGLFANNIDGGYMFAAFSVLGDGGESWARVFTTSLAGSGTDYNGTGAGFAFRNSATTGLYTLASGLAQIQTGMFDDANGDILYEVKLKNSEFTAKLNNAGFLSATHDGTIDSDQFNIGQDFVSTQNGAIDLEYLALFPATITDAEAARVVNYINNRNTVFDLKDSLGYYFFDPQSITDSDITSTLFTGDWDGRIVGSDLGDNTLEITQGTGGNQPVADKYKLTFADDNDHLLFDSAYTPPFPAGQDKAWQICGTSLGTFAYKINNNSQTELSLLGNLGNASHRKAGNLYGIILLPETATGADIEAARKLLIDRGAADGATSSSLYTYWLGRSDIVEFKSVNTSSVIAFTYAWNNCTSLTSFPAIDMSSGNNFLEAWQNCPALTSFPAIDMSSGTSFESAWQSCTGLTSFPSGAKLGTAVTGVDFSNAWMFCSSLTSFPALDMSSGTSFTGAWQNCTALTSFPADAKLGTAAVTGVNFTSAFQTSGLTALPAGLDMSQGDAFNSAFESCGSLATIGTGVLLGTANATATVDFSSVFRGTAITELPAGLDMSQGDSFEAAFYDCGSLATIGSGVLLGTAHATATVNFDYSFYNTALTELPAGLDMSQGYTFLGAFLSCTSLTTIGSGVLLGTASSGVDFGSAFRSSGLTALPANLNLSQGDNFLSAFSGCTSLTTIGSGVLLGTASSNVNFAGVFRTCTALESLPAGLDMSQGNTFDGAFFDCSSLTTIGNGVLLGTASSSVEFSYAFYNTGLTELPANLNLSQGDSFYATFQNCSSLVTFPAGAFDTMGTPADYCFYNAWLGCGSLSGASVDAILDSIEASGQLAPSTGPEITITYNTATGTPLYDSVPSLFARGWNVMVNSVAVTNTSATDLIIDSMAISTLSVVSGLSPVYNRLGNPAEYGDNISRIGNLGTDANDPVQTVEAEQPVFRDVGNEADYGDGYLYCDGVAGSYASVPDAANLNGLTDFVMEAKDVYMDDWATGNETFFSKFGSGAGGSAFTFRRTTGSINFYAVYGNVGVNSYFSHGLTGAATASIRITRVGTSVTAELDTGSGYVAIGNTQTVPAVAIDTTLAPVEIGGREIGTVQPLTGKIGQATIWDNGAQTGDPVLDVDFRNATHKLTDTDTLTATSGQTITLNGGATVYNPPIAPLHGYLHLSGTAGNYASVPDPLGSLGDFVMEAKDVYMADWTAAGAEVFFSSFSNGVSGFLFRRSGSGINLYAYYSGGSNHVLIPHGITGAATASIRVTRAGTSVSTELDTGSGYVTIGSTATVPAAAIDTPTTPLEIGSYNTGVYNLLTGKIGQARIWDNATSAGTAVLDVNFATDPALESDTSFTASSGQTVTIHQSTLTGDRAKLVHSSEIFYDGAADEFNFTLSSPFTGKMLVASTQGILVADASRSGSLQIEHRGVGDVTSLTHPGGGLEQKGVMLLSPSSSPAALTSAFVARGAVKSFAARTEFGKAFRYMGLTSFPTIDISNGVNCYAAFERYFGTTFPALNFASATNLATAWFASPNLTSLPAIQAPVCSEFTSAWQSNTALATIDPAANFGESATGVNFSDTFNNASGLTELPAGLDLSTGDKFIGTFNGCSSLATIGNGVLLGTASTSVDFSYAFYNCTNLVTLPANLNLSSGTDFQSAFRGCSSLVTFPAGAFDTMGTPQNWCFQYAWYGCSSLSGASVDAILDSIDASPIVSAPTIVTSEANIVITYDDTGTAAPAYTTLASLKAKGWVVIVNNVTL